jgi:cytochrome c6
MSARSTALVLALAGATGAVQADDAGRKLFTSVSPACALCHKLKDAGAVGEIGPSLDELKPDRERVIKALRSGIGQMPAFTHLTEAEVQALAAYIEKATQSLEGR